MERNKVLSRDEVIRTHWMPVAELHHISGAR